MAIHQQFDTKPQKYCNLLIESPSIDKGSWDPATSFPKIFTKFQRLKWAKSPKETYHARALCVYGASNKAFIKHLLIKCEVLQEAPPSKDTFVDHSMCNMEILLPRQNLAKPFSNNRSMFMTLNAPLFTVFLPLTCTLFRMPSEWFQSCVTQKHCWDYIFSSFFHCTNLCSQSTTKNCVHNGASKILSTPKNSFLYYMQK